MSDNPLVPEPLYGLRTWRVRGEQGDERLAGPQKESNWPAGGVWLEAVCLEDPLHDAPVHDCACGIHAFHPERTSARRVFASRHEQPGLVEATGRVELHAEGFRAERARPYALFVRPGDNAARAERMAALYGAEAVPVETPDALLDWCRARGLGLEPPVVASLLGSDRYDAAIQARERRRKRSRLRIAIAAAVVAALLALGIIATADPGGRPLYGRTGEVHHTR